MMPMRNSLASSSVYSENPLLSQDSESSFWVDTPPFDQSSSNKDSVYTETGSDSSSRITQSVNKAALTFDRNSVINGVVYLNDKLVYAITTNASGTRTDICNVHEQQWTFIATDTGNFIWKTSSQYRLALFSEDDSRQPIAFTYRSDRAQPPVLNLQGGSRILDDILVSFVVLEQRMRMKEKRRQNGMLYGPLTETGICP
ncbi:hypothetical protein CPB83DRAFT_906989 [Crepidotus variabilis]|uniref:DUF6593 domain-containing protein n=1 Tax=Crepidotus variabilis TaxID=179855 RepID=A0A9P6EG03_9AGAR|nr:hypothetical protein CPB83DRAFT_906989 [Crepidotus variabilis]